MIVPERRFCTGISAMLSTIGTTRDSPFSQVVAEGSAQHRDRKQRGLRREGKQAKLEVALKSPPSPSRGKA